MTMNGDNPSKQKGLREFYEGLSPGRRGGLWSLLGAELILNALAQRDLSRRSADEVRGPKLMWRVIAMQNFIGPGAYFLFGRRRSAAADAG